MNPIPSKAQNPTGIHKRYILSKLDGTPVDTKADYFVLRLDYGGRDPVHVAACRAAILTYAAHIAGHIPKLAEDIRARYDSPPPTVFRRKTNAIGKSDDLQELPGKATEDENKTES